MNDSNQDRKLNIEIFFFFTHNYKECWHSLTWFPGLMDSPPVDTLPHTPFRRALKDICSEQNLGQLQLLTRNSLFWKENESTDLTAHEINWWVSLPRITESLPLVPQGIPEEGKIDITMWWDTTQSTLNKLHYLFNSILCLTMLKF